MDDWDFGRKIGTIPCLVQCLLFKRFISVIATSIVLMMRKMRDIYAHSKPLLTYVY